MFLEDGGSPDDPSVQEVFQEFLKEQEELNALPANTPISLNKSIERRMNGGATAVKRGVGEIMSLVPGTDVLAPPSGGGKFRPGMLRWVSRNDAKKVRETLLILGFRQSGARVISKGDVYVHFIPAPPSKKSPGFSSLVPGDVLIANTPTRKIMFFLDKLIGKDWS
jgi:hypothetical protein